MSTMGIDDFVETIGGKSVRRKSKPGKEPQPSAPPVGSAEELAQRHHHQRALECQRWPEPWQEIADNINNELLANVGVDRAELANKLRQPLGELVADNKIHTIGEKRPMKYHNGPGKRSSSVKQPFPKSSSGFTNRGPLCLPVASRIGSASGRPSNIRLRVPSCFCSSSPDADTTEEDKESWQGKTRF